MSDEDITIATDAVLKQSSKSFCSKSKTVFGYPFEDAAGELEFDLNQVISAYETTGFGATQLAKAIDVVNKMIEERMTPFKPDTKIEDEFIRPKTACPIFLATPNIAEDSIRKHIRLLVKYKLVDCIVTSKVGIEQDLIKSLNLSQNQELESISFIKTLLTDLLKERAIWIPSQLIERIGLKVNHPDAISHWAAVNKIPIFCPSLDFDSRDFVLDLIGDIRRINTFAHNTASLKTGVIVLGGGIPKHHTMNANLMRNGADYAVYMNAAPEFDGSDSGANPDEAISWGKIRAEAKVIKVTGCEKEAFPRLVERTFLNHIKLHDESDRPQVDIAKQFISRPHEPGPNRMTAMSAVEIINEMLDKRMIDFHPDMSIEDEFIRPKSECSIFLAYTSNMGSSGVRENIRFLVKHNLVDCIVATAGGIEEDLIKCLELEPELHASTYVGDFSRWPGSILRENGINRIGNLYVPNDNYCRFEDWLMPILDKMLDEQKIWTPSELVRRLGLEVNHPSSICYWAAKNNIPIFCPALTDGSLGDMLYFHSFRSSGLVLNPNRDRIRIDSFARNTKNHKVGLLILGGGAIEEYLMKAMQSRGGIDYGVFINTAAEFNRSASNAKLERLMSEGKLRSDAKIMELTRCASLLFAELIGLTFFNFLKNKNQKAAKR